MQTNEMDRVVFTASAEEELARLLAAFAPEDVFVLADGNTRRFLPGLLGGRWLSEERIATVPPGESSKSPEGAAAVWSVLHRGNARRSSLLVNVGGGVVTDLGGFAASVFKRGMAFVNVPTTLLAQVDASVGGKTGINFMGIKNEVGLFAFPERVIVSPGFLPFLPERELRSGLAEMLKHGLLDSPDHLRRVMSVDGRTVDSPEFLRLVRASVAVKAAFVARDPGERGPRHALNLGHTVGHALESLSWEDGAPLSHGEAVAWGLVAELWLSVREKGFPRAVFEEVRAFVRRRYPPCLAGGRGERLLEIMSHDKKNDRPGVNFTLLEDVGKYTINNYCSPESVREALRMI